MESTHEKCLRNLRNITESRLLYGFRIGITPEAIGKPIDVIQAVYQCSQAGVPEETISQTLSAAREAAWQRFLGEHSDNGNGHWPRPWQPR